MFDVFLSGCLLHRQFSYVYYRHSLLFPYPLPFVTLPENSRQISPQICWRRRVWSTKELVLDFQKILFCTHDKTTLRSPLPPPERSAEILLELHPFSTVHIPRTENPDYLQDQSENTKSKKHFLLHFPAPAIVTVIKLKIQAQKQIIPILHLSSNVALETSSLVLAVFTQPKPTLSLVNVCSPLHMASRQVVFKHQSVRNAGVLSFHAGEPLIIVKPVGRLQLVVPHHISCYEQILGSCPHG